MPDPKARLISDETIAKAIEGMPWARYHTTTGAHDIAEAHMLLGLAPNVDIMSSAMLVELVRRIVLLERQFGAAREKTW